ncbi:hypothetical protein [Xylocopilactobacillus apis]|uniref:Uncharacterized protein n=1 Tax=Xylocopilactobacillus apis TaxID=2932183 RepID=A0AAU9CZU0_9LACO|nr:hypothetical protein [Xylocopilactobacillus apis]BDR55781.1 hypothetical protein KIMC2_03430 [Xylocopilactobacillus apis]
MINSYKVSKYNPQYKAVKDWTSYSNIVSTVSKSVYQQMENNYLDVIEQVAICSSDKEFTIRKLENFNHISDYREGQVINQIDELQNS